MITSFQKIFGCFGMRRCAAALALATAAVVGSGVAGCSKEDTPAGSRVGETVLVRLPGVSVAAPVEVVPGAWGASAAAAGTRGIMPRTLHPAPLRRTLFPTAASLRPITPGSCSA